MRKEATILLHPGYHAVSFSIMRRAKHMITKSKISYVSINGMGIRLYIYPISAYGVKWVIPIGVDITST